jgi:hypothetical protein
MSVHDHRPGTPPPIQRRWLLWTGGPLDRRPQTLSGAKRDTRDSSEGSLSRMAILRALLRLDDEFKPQQATAFGKAHRRPKQTKSKKTLMDPDEVKAPGDLVSVDVLVSSTPGLIAQMAEFLTRKGYKYACVFVDHFSDFGYVI